MLSRRQPTPTARPAHDRRSRLTDLLLQWEELRDQGQEPTPEGLCRDCPEMLGPFREAIRALAGLDPLLGTVATAPVASPAAHTPPSPWCYRPLALHARGGLGEVVLAEDTELDRRVALKEIQGRFADLPDSRARFLREGRITAHLEHPGIVPVYGLGIYPDGRPYYAMRFIKGESLHDAIRRFHQADANPRDRGERELALRTLLTRFVGVCNAVGYAHSRGVIHRDLKPANVMLGDYGEALVVDWGLARLVGSGAVLGEERPLRLAADDTQPRAGQVAGTPAFMPPEQARGELDQVGPTSDVFALGAVLYAILTGAPPYGGPDALDQARQAAPPPARARNQRAPAALEAVCRRAMAAAPDDRYATARELAEEVERWLADEPVIAFREPLGTRARRCGRRHRSAVVGAVVLLAASAVALGVGLWAVNRERAKTVEALANAEMNLTRALIAEGEAKENFSQSQVNLARAEANLSLARQAVDDCFTIAWKAPEFQGLRMEPAKKLLFKQTLPFYKRFDAERPDDPGLQADVARQQTRIAMIEYALGGLPAAVEGYGQARGRYARLLEQQPNDPGHKRGLAQVRFGLGNALMLLGRVEEGLAEHREAIELRQRAAGSPDGTAEERQEMALYHNNLGIALHRLGRNREALEQHLRARDALFVLAAQRPRDPSLRQDLAGTFIGLGNVRRAMGGPAGALSDYEQARELLRDLARSKPDDLDPVQGQASAHLNCGGVLALIGRPQAARAEMLKARALQVRLTLAHPILPAYRYELATTHHNLGRLLIDLGQPAAAEEEVQHAASALARLIAGHPTVPGYARLLADVRTALGEIAVRRGQPLEGLRELRLACEALAAAIEHHPTAPELREGLARARNDIGWLLSGFGRLEQALGEYESAHQIQKALVKEGPGRADRRRALARILLNRGSLLASGLNRPREGLADLNEGIKLLEGLTVEAAPTVVAEMLHQGLAQRAEALGLLGRYREAVADLDRGLRLAPPALHTNLRLRRASALAQSGDHRAAAAEANELGRASRSGPELYHLAWVWAACHATASADRGQPLPVREREAERYARQAVALLGRSAPAGLFAGPRDVAALDAEPRFGPLRGREDYKRFRSGLGR